MGFGFSFQRHANKLAFVAAVLILFALVASSAFGGCSSELCGFLRFFMALMLTIIGAMAYGTSIKLNHGADC